MRFLRVSVLLVVVAGALVGTATAADPRFRFADQQLAAGTQQLEVPLLVSHDTDILGLQVYGTYDPAVLRLDEITLQATDLDGKDLALFLKDLTSPNFGVAILWAGETGQVNLLPPGQDHKCLRLQFAVGAGAPLPTTTRVTFVRDAPISYQNGVFVGDELVPPVFVDGAIELGAAPGRRFLRGDADDSGLLDISDPIRTLSYLFLGAERPPCLDAADVFDRGVVDISSPIAALSFLFSGGPPPAAPFPDAGVDPTPDALECE